MTTGKTIAYRKTDGLEVDCNALVILKKMLSDILILVM